MFVSLFSVIGFPSFKEYISEETPFSDCFQIYYLWYGKKDLGKTLFQCLNIAPMKKACFMTPMEYTLIIYSPNEKGMVL